MRCSLSFASLALRKVLRDSKWCQRDAPLVEQISTAAATTYSEVAHYESATGKPDPNDCSKASDASTY